MLFYWESLVYFSEMIPNHGCGCIPAAWLHSKSPGAKLAWRSPETKGCCWAAGFLQQACFLTSKEQMKRFSGKQLLKAAIKFKMNKSNSLVSAFATVLFSVLLHCFYLESQSTPVLLKSRNNLLILSFKLSSGCFFYFEWSLTEFLCVNRWKHWWLPRCVKMISGTCLSGVVQIVNTFY